MNNYPIWKDTVYASSDTEFDLNEKIGGEWVKKEHIRCSIMPDKEQIEVCINKLVDTELKSELPQEGISVHSNAYKQYKIGNNEYGFVQDWSYEEWNGNDRILSDPINLHMDPRMMVIYTQFSNNGGDIEVDKEHIVKPYISIIPTSYLGMGNEESFTVSIKSNDTWMIVQQLSWATVSSASGKGDAEITVSLERNDGLQSRSGEMIFYALKGASAELVITQLQPVPVQPNNEIWYTSANGNIIEPSAQSEPFSANIISNTYSDGKGIIRFDGYITSIPNYAFIEVHTDSNLTSISIPNSVTSIGDAAFSACRNLTRLNSDTDGVFNIPDLVTIIDDFAFAGCYCLTSITIPDSVTSIGNHTFYECTNLASITIGNSVTTIGGYAFQSCTSLTNITIPNSVTSIRFMAFMDCTGLSEITYNGTMAQWQNISKDENWKYNVPATVVHCSDGDVAI